MQTPLEFYLCDSNQNAMVENGEYQEWLDEAASNRQVVTKQFANWKKKKPKNLDTLFHTEHTAVFDKVDCLTCANCCKTTSPIFRDVDIRRIAKQQRMSEAAFIRQYLRMDEDGDYVLQSSPCAFLFPDNTCSIYEYRPLACREYPHTDRKNMVQILDLTAKNTEVCPAVAKIVQNLIDGY